MLVSAMCHMNVKLKSEQVDGFWVGRRGKLLALKHSSWQEVCTTSAAKSYSETLSQISFWVVFIATLNSLNQISLFFNYG